MVGYEVDDFKSYPDTCNTCSCENRKVSCTQDECPSESSSSCLHKENKYLNGTTFTEPCKICKCNEGKVQCTFVGLLCKVI